MNTNGALRCIVLEAGEGDFIPVKPGKHMWETNFLPDASMFKLHEWAARGKGAAAPTSLPF